MAAAIFSPMMTRVFLPPSFHIHARSSSSATEPELFCQARKLLFHAQEDTRSQNLRIKTTGAADKEEPLRARGILHSGSASVMQRHSLPCTRSVIPRTHAPAAI